MAVSHADPSEFAVSVAVGSAHVLASLGGATRSHAAAVLLAVPVLLAYLAAVTLAFAARVAADCYAGVVAACGGDDDDAPRATVQAHRAAAAVGGWLADLVVRLAVPALLFGALSFACALLKFSSQTDL